MSPRSQRAVLFDLDDTLYDHRRSAREAVRAICRTEPALARETVDAVDRVNRQLLEEIHGRVLAGEIDIDQAREERMERLLAHFGQSDAAVRAPDLARLYRQSYQAVKQPAPGAHTLLGTLRARGCRLGVVTNNVTQEQEEKMDLLGFTPLVDELVVSESVGAWKPDPAIFRVALERLGVRAENAVMVGDSWESDMVGAVRCGIRAVWYNPLGTGRPGSDIAIDGEIRSFDPAELVADAILGAFGSDGSAG